MTVIKEIRTVSNVDLSAIIYNTIQYTNEKVWDKNSQNCKCMNEKPRTEKKIDENPSEENMFLNHWRLQRHTFPDYS